MRTLAFLLAAVFSTAAIAGQWLAWPRGLTIAALVAAGAFLAWAFWITSQNAQSAPKELDAEQRETIARMKAEGNTPLAIQQVQLWFRNTTPEEAAAIVRGV